MSVTKRSERGAILLGDFARELSSPVVPPAESWRPIRIQLSPGELSGLNDMCHEHGITVLDRLDHQLGELAHIQLPSAGRPARERFVAELMADAGGPEACGLWIYFPWDRRVVHVLGREDYLDVITDRNRDKITREELRILQTKRIGVVGLSVGGEAAVTVAQEHLAGRIVLADYDTLDLSNLNRLNAGCDELGLNKAVIAARRIVRIDPYIDVTIFEEGVTSENMEDFLRGLDLLIEECDGLAMKFALRRYAHEQGIDMVFAADERGFLSVEPYGSHPELLPFHGRIDGPQRPRDGYATPLDFMKALTEWMGGWGEISDASRRSLRQLGTTLSGYPQLAGEARFAAGQVAHVSRRLLLGEPLAPFLGHLDLESWLPTIARDGDTP